MWTVRDWFLENHDLQPGGCETFTTEAEAEAYYKSLDGRRIALVELWDDQSERRVKTKGIYRSTL